MTKAGPNLQDAFLNCVRKEKVSVVIYMLDGSQLKGNLKSFDSFTILLDTGGKTQLVYKHAIGSILPTKHLGDALNRNAHEPS